MIPRKIKLRKHRTSLAVASLVPALLATSARAESPTAATPGYPEPVVQWGVQKDETCEDVAKAMYGSAKHVGLLLRYNRIDCTRGKKLAAGVTLVLPASVTSLPTARLRSLNPQVKARPAGGAWGPAAAGQPLVTNSGVNTLETGRADIEFIDRTRVFLASNTLVIIYGTASQSAVSKTVPPAVEVQSGEVKAGLAALRGETVEVSVTGGGRVSAASRETIVERKGERTTVGVYDGNANVTSGGKTVNVPLNYGTRFNGSGVPSPPRPLPPAPAWEATTSAFVMAPSTGGTIRADWAAVKDAKAYRVEIARDDTFRDLLAREEVAGDVRSFRADKMPPGRYFVAVRAIDTEEYLGVAAKRTVDVVEVELGVKNATIAGTEVTANPYATITLKSGVKTDFAIDDGPFGPMPDALDLSKRGPARLRFKPLGATEPFDFTVRYTEVAAKIVATLSADRRTASVDVSFRGLDEIDIPARVAPALRVNDGKTVAQVALLAGAGRFTATIPAPAPDASLRLDVVDARGAVLGTGSVSSAPPAEAPAPPVLPGGHSGVEAKVPAIGMTSELWQPSPITGVAFWSPTARNAASAAVLTSIGSGGAGFRFQGSATGALGRFGVDASIRSRTYGDIDGPDDAHDDGAWLGGRVRAVRFGDATFEAGFSARFGFPVSSFGPGLRFEPSMAAGGAIGAFTYLANLGLRIRLSEQGTTVPDGQGFLLAGGTYDFTEWLRAGATLDAHVLHFDRAEDALVRGGLSLHLEAGTFLFGALSARVSPWEDDGSAFRDGEFSARLAIGLRAR